MELKEIANALNNLVQIEVKTIVGNYKVESGNIIPDVEAKVLYSRIDLLNGDITTAINHDFLQEPMHSLLQLQKEREAQSQQLIHSNIQALKELATLVVTLAQQDSQISSTPPASNTVPISSRTGSSTV